MQKNENLSAFLSIDAFSVKPSLIITNEGLISGSTFDQEIDLEKFNELKLNYLLFEEFCKNQTKYMINDVFVINLLPLNNSLLCQLIHKNLQTNGKANTYIMDELFEVAKEVQKQNINLLGISYDGDTSYNKLTNYSLNNIVKKILLDPH